MRHHRWTTALAGACVATVAVATAGCSSGGSGGLKPSGSTTGVAAALGQVPDKVAYSKEFTYLDWTAARKLAGVDELSSSAGEEKTANYLLALTSRTDSPVAFAPAFPSLQSAHLPDLRDELGFGFAEIDQSISAGEPPNTVTVLHGRFDTDAIDHAATTAKPWNKQLDTTTHGDFDVYSWGDDNEVNVDQISAIRPTGVGGRLAVHDDTLVWANATAPLEGSIDAIGGDTDSLADNDDFAAIAKALDDRHAYQAWITGDAEDYTLDRALGGNASPSQVDTLREQITDELLPTWEAAAAGSGVEGGKRVDLFVFAYDNSGDANDAASKLRDVFSDGDSIIARRPLSDLVKLDDVEVDGSLVVAKVKAKRVQTLADIVEQGDVPFLHE